MFSYIYNLFCDGEYITGFNDTDALEAFWNDVVAEHGEDHEYQVLALIKGAV